MDNTIMLLAKLLQKDVLILHIEDALLAYKKIPTDDNFQKVATCATLIAIKEEADGKNVNEVLEQLAADTIPFFTASAN